MTEEVATMSASASGTVRRVIKDTLHGSDGGVRLKDIRCTDAGRNFLASIVVWCLCRPRHNRLSVSVFGQKSHFTFGGKYVSAECDTTLSVYFRFRPKVKVQAEV